MHLKKQRQLFNKVNNFNGNKKNINELLADISVYTKNTSVSVNSKLNILKIFSIIYTLLYFFKILLFSEQTLNLKALFNAFTLIICEIIL